MAKVRREAAAAFEGVEEAAVPEVSVPVPVPVEEELLPEASVAGVPDGSLATLKKFG